MTDFNMTAFAEDGRWLNVAYECPCGEHWESQWSCECDDECPSCGATVMASDSEDLTGEHQAEMAEALDARGVEGLADVRQRLRGGTATDADLAAAGDALRAVAGDDAAIGPSHDAWHYDEASREIRDGNGLKVARDVLPADAARIIAAGRS